MAWFLALKLFFPIRKLGNRLSWPTRSIQIQVELSEWATGYFMHWLYELFPRSTNRLLHSSFHDKHFIGNRPTNKRWYCQWRQIWRHYTSLFFGDQWAPFYKHRSTLIPAWISNHMPSEVWDEITYPLWNFNGSTIEVWEWIISSHTK